MSGGFQTTIRLLSETANEAAIPVLVAALHSSRTRVRQAALEAILARRSPAGHREVLRRLNAFDEQAKQLILQHAGRMTHAIRDAMLGSDPQLCEHGCLAAVWFREYDLIPALITCLEAEANPNVQIAGKTLLELTDLLYGELSEPCDDGRRRDPQRIRHRVVGDLERSVAKFAKHQRREIIDAFVLLVKRDNVTLRQVLRDPHHAAFRLLVEVLSENSAGGVIRLLLGFLGDPRAPSVALSVVAKRSDLKFVRYLLRKVGREPSEPVKQNLKRIKSISWVRDGLALLDELEELEQHAAVRLVMHSGTSRAGAFTVVEHVLRHAEPGGRRAASEALGEFSGAKANELTLLALNDQDPEVQANALAQLRHRGIPGALPRLVQMVDSPHAAVRKAARESLAEFSFHRFLAAFDVLDDEVRRSTGALVKKVDPQTIPLLKAEMESRIRTRRLRGLTIARTIDAVAQLEETVTELLQDEDHLVRTEAALALAQCDSLASLAALREVEQDRSASVREAAVESLRNRAQSNQWRERLSDP